MLILYGRGRKKYVFKVQKTLLMAKNENQFLVVTICHIIEVGNYFPKFRPPQKMSETST